MQPFYNWHNNYTQKEEHVVVWEDVSCHCSASKKNTQGGNQFSIIWNYFVRLAAQIGKTKRYQTKCHKVT